jgi:membrane protein YdbS with pleckstrin-like domain
MNYRIRSLNENEGELEPMAHDEYEELEEVQEDLTFAVTDKFFIRRNGKVKGPMDAKRIRKLVKSKKLKPSDEISLSVDGSWDRLSTVYKKILRSSYPQSETGVCDDCGKSVPENAKTCCHCGAPLDDDHDELEPEAYGEYSDDEDEPPEDAAYDDGLGFSVEQFDGHQDISGGNVLSVGEAVGSVGKAYRDAKETLGSSKKIPEEVRELLTANEAIYYAGRPSELALKIKIFFFFIGLLPLILPLLGSSASMITKLISVVIWFAVFAIGWYLMRTEWKNTIYVVTNKRIVARKGLFNRGIRMIPVQNIQTMSVDTGIIDRWLGFNKVAFMTSATLFGGIVFRHVDSSDVMKAVGKALIR